MNSVDMVRKLILSEISPIAKMAIVISLFEVRSLFMVSPVSTRGKGSLAALSAFEWLLFCVDSEVLLEIIS
jgi:hypothetical protein